MKLFIVSKISFHNFNLFCLGNVRDLCAAPFANEGWFRGAITSIDIAKRSANIFFLDYGDTVSVGMDQLKKLRLGLTVLFFVHWIRRSILYFFVTLI